MRTYLLIPAAVAMIALGLPGLTQAQTVRQQAAYGINGAGQKIAFTDEERMIIRRYVHPAVPYRITTGEVSGGVAIAPGDRVPDGVLLHPFPAAVYHEAPELAAYRYIRLGARAYAVDPRDRTIVEEINR